LFIVQGKLQSPAATASSEDRTETGVTVTRPCVRHEANRLVCGGIAPLIRNIVTRWGVRGKINAPAALPREMSPLHHWVLNGNDAGWATGPGPDV